MLWNASCTTKIFEGSSATEKMKYTYLLIDLASFILPFLFSFHKKIRFDRKWLPYIKANILMAVVFIVWDILFTEKGVWGFNEAHLTGVTFFNLPIEEVLFFFAIPYACTFMYHCFNIFQGKRGLGKMGKWLVAGLATLLLITGIINLDQIYTSVTFIVTSAYLFYLVFLEKKQYAGSFLLNFLLVLIPFAIVNGILTGSFIENEIVWYNNAENLSIRIGTIPIEDSMYALLMLGMLVSLMEFFDD